MPLPSPDYLLLFDILHRDIDEEIVAIDPLVESGTPLALTSPATMLHWEGLLPGYQEQFHTTVEEYAVMAGSIAEVDWLTDIDVFGAIAGFQFANFLGTVVGGNASGLDVARTYTANFLIDGTTTVNAVVDGATATTFTLVVGELNTALAANATAAITNGDISVQSDGATGGGTTAVEFSGGSLWPALGMFGFGIPRVEIDTIADSVTGFTTLVGPVNAETLGLFWSTFQVTHEGPPPVSIFPHAGTLSTVAYHDPFTDEWKRLIDDVVIV